MNGKKRREERGGGEGERWRKSRIKEGIRKVRRVWK